MTRSIRWLEEEIAQRMLQKMDIVKIQPQDILLLPDIPEKYAKSRRVFRSKLSELNCKPIQKSVWISPDDIAINIEKLINLLHLQGEVNYFICKALNDENKFRRLFNIDKD